MSEPRAVVIRTPLRVSFAGGGTDLPAFSDSRCGTVVSTAITRYVFVRAERTRDSSDAEQRVGSGIGAEIVRRCRELVGVEPPVRMRVSTDTPPSSGLGGSASLAVGVLHALHALRGDPVSPRLLAEEACHVEIAMLGRPIGRQDQYAAAFGGLNTLHFGAGPRVRVEPLAVDPVARAELFGALMLLWTGVSHDAGAVLQALAGRPPDGKLTAIRGHALQMRAMLSGSLDISAIGSLMHETWCVKRELAGGVSWPALDAWYERARAAGALGGKMCGAGGGGCLLLIVPAARRGRVRAALPELAELPIGYAERGSEALTAPPT